MTEPDIDNIMRKIDDIYFKENNYYLSQTHPKTFTLRIARIYAQMHVLKATKDLSISISKKLFDDYNITLDAKDIASLYDISKTKFK